MQDGRIIFTTEKREPAFYELALRRMNLDGSDYHPLFSQRGSLGYYEARDVVELADKNFVAVFSDPGMPYGGGTLGLFNRSIGVDFTSTTPSDYPIDPSVINPAAAASPEPSFFLHSLDIPDTSVSGHAGQSTTGVYTSPATAPQRRHSRELRGGDRRGDLRRGLRRLRLRSGDRTPEQKLLGAE